MIIENRRTREKRTMSLEEFKKEFANDIQAALESYKKTELSKPYFKFNKEGSVESDFYFSLQWNFNNHGNSSWFIRSM